MSRKLKILQINKYPSVKGGSEIVLFDTIDLLKKQGHEVVLFSTDEGTISHNPTYTLKYPDRKASLVDKITHLHSFFYNKQATRRLQLIIEKEQPDIAHIHLYLNGLSQSILPVLKRSGVPVVMTLHDYRQICPSYLLLNRHQNICERCIGGNYLNCMFTRCSKGSFVESTLLTMEMYYRRLFYKTEKYVDKFICVSNFQFDKHKQFNDLIASKLEVIYNPVKMYPDNSAKKGNYILFFGRLSKEKGLGTLLSAMKNLPDVKLKIAGKGDMPLPDIPANAEFLGFKENAELSRLIKDAMFTVVPSEWYETFGLSCAESLAQGTPVIASDIGAIPEIVKHKHNGFLFKPKDADALTNTIEQALRLSDEAYAAMVENGYKSIEKFSAADYISKLLSVYNSLLDNKS